jgi:hypothetical protein
MFRLLFLINQLPKLRVASSNLVARSIDLTVLRTAPGSGGEFHGALFASNSRWLAGFGRGWLALKKEAIQND